MINRIVNNPWWKFVVGICAIFAFFGITGNRLLMFFTNNSWLLNAIAFSLLWGAFIFGIHAYYRANRYLKERKSIMDAILILIQKCSSIEEMEQEIQKLNSIIDKPDYEELLNKALNIKIDT